CVPAVVVGKRMEVSDADVDALARLDIRYLLLENVRPPLHEQARTIALRTRLVVELLRLFLLAQNSADLSIADRHHELANGRVLGQWEQVNRLDLLGVRVAELLPH